MRVPNMLVITRVAAGVATFLLAWENGGYGTSAWTTIGALTGWCLVLVVLLGIGSRPSRGAMAILALLVAFAVWTGISTLWASGADAPIGGMEKTLVYAGVFALIVVVVPVALRSAAIDGIGLGLVAVTVVALTSRFFPSHFPAPAANLIVPGAASRLSYPVGYWNALAVLTAFAWPLMLRIATDRQRGRLRWGAFIPLPAVVAVTYLASSRAGALAIVVGAAVFVLLSSDRLVSLTGVFAGSTAGVLLVVWLHAHSVLVDGPFSGRAVAHAGHRAALATLLAGALAALAYAGAARALEGFAPPKALRQGAAVAIGVLLVLAVVLAHPIRRWDAFTRTPTAPDTLDIRSHLFSSNGNYRWQYWTATVDELRTAPLIGRGAGAFERWWDVHGNLFGFVQNAHSLYFETLGDLGLVGFGLIVSLVVVALVSTIRRANGSTGALRNDRAAVAAVFAAFAVAIGVDWVWDMPALTIVALALLALTLGEPEARPLTVSRPVRFALCGACVLFALLEVDHLAANVEHSRSTSQAAAGRLSAAEQAARTATRLEPWSASAYVQLALVREARKDYDGANAAVRTALSRDSGDWRNWYVMSQLARAQGRTAEARSAFDRALRLNPHSPLLNAAKLDRS